MNILESNGEYRFFNEMTIHRSLTGGRVYNFSLDSKGNPILTNGLSLQFPAKIYDFDMDFRQQVLTTLHSPISGNNIGVLLIGHKGQGKSLIAKLLAKESKLPIICINAPIPKTVDFVSFLDQIHQNHVLLIDEFEKSFSNYDSDESDYHSQEAFLSMLSGVNEPLYKRLVILTTNDDVNDKLINRPSRIRYNKQYEFMPDELYNAIIKDKLKDKKFKKELDELLDKATCTIDLLSTIIEEINIQNKPYSKFREFFNHKQEKVTYSRYIKGQKGGFEYVDDVKSNRVIGNSDERRVKEVVGWDAEVISIEEGVILYKAEGKGNQKKIYKLERQEWRKNKLVF